MSVLRTPNLLLYFFVAVAAGVLPCGFGLASGTSPACASPQFCSATNTDARIIEKFVREPPISDGAFHVQGWRWHTMSLIREAKRLHKLAVKIEREANTDAINDLKTTADYTVDFNMRGLHRVERDLFFPWLRKKTECMEEQQVAQAFVGMIADLEHDRSRIEALGTTLLSKAKDAADVSKSHTDRLNAVQQVAADAIAIAESANSMFEKEESLLVPAVAKLIPESEQKSFNNKVIAKLGILDSRLHLVGMREAVWALDNKAERQLFKDTIPSIPQKMIPRWKRLIYDPLHSVDVD